MVMLDSLLWASRRIKIKLIDEIDDETVVTSCIRQHLHLWWGIGIISLVNKRTMIIRFLDGRRPANRSLTKWLPA